MADAQKTWTFLFVFLTCSKTIKRRYEQTRKSWSRISYKLQSTRENTHNVNALHFAITTHSTQLIADTFPALQAYSWYHHHNNMVLSVQ